MLEGIIFDYDGVISDTFDRQFEWFKSWAAINSKKFSFNYSEDFRDYYNEIMENSHGDVQKVYDSLHLPCDMVDHSHPVWENYKNFSKNYQEHFFEGIPQIITQLHSNSRLSSNPLKNNKTRMGINSTNTWENIYKRLIENQIIDCFDSFVSAEVLEYYAGNKLGKNIKKPSKVAIDCSLRVLNSSGSKTLYFGDTIDDLRACNDVGLGHRKESLITVGVSWGYLGRERLEAGYKDKENKENYDFDYIIDKPKEILDIFHEVSNNF